MDVFEVVYPGTWIDLPDPEVAFGIQGDLESVHSCLDEAAIVLKLFVETQAAERQRLNCQRGDSEGQETNVPSDGSSDLSARMISDPEKSDEIYSEWVVSQIERRRRHWESGGVPYEYIRCLPRIYARTFLFTVWKALQFFEKLAKRKDVPGQVGEIVGALKAALPGLRGLRDSSAHIDERLDGKARNKKIISKAIDSQFAKVPAGSFILSENLFGNRFVGTTESGDLAELAVDKETLVQVQRALQSIVSCFKWHGPARVCPES